MCFAYARTLAALFALRSSLLSLVPSLHTLTYRTLPAFFFSVSADVCWVLDNFAHRVALHSTPYITFGEHNAAF